MKTVACLIKTIRENLRDWKILILTVVLAPFFIYLMHLYMGNERASEYRIIIINNDGNGQYSREMLTLLKTVKTEEGTPVIRITETSDTAIAGKMIRDREADLLITIPEDFSETFAGVMSGDSSAISPFINYGDPSNIRFLTASSYADYLTFMYISERTGIKIPFDVQYEYAGTALKRSEFDLYVPALLVLSIIMMLFTAGASIVREVERDTITRLSLSKVSSGEFMTAMSISQVIIGIICLFLTLLAAFSVGYKTQGSVSLLLFAGVLTCFSVVSISIITASFIRTMFGLLTLGCFPFFILMFFSDCFMPLPKIDLISIAGNKLFLNDLLPTATATRAFNKILNFNSGFYDISFELAWIFLLSVVYFVIGIKLFKRKYGY